jgi:hypothetical protein
MQLNFHSVAVVVTLVTNKNIHERNNTKQSTNNTKHSKYKHTYYQNTHTIVKTTTHKHTHILQNKLKQPQHKIHTHQIK